MKEITISLKNNDKAYFLGWLFTDGYVKEGKTKGFGGIVLQITDLEILKSYGNIGFEKNPI